MITGGIHLSDIILHLLEKSHPLRNLGLLLLLLQLFFLDLGLGLSSLGACLHQVAGLALRHYMQRYEMTRYLPEIAVDCWKIRAISGSMEMTLLPSRATLWLRLLT